MEDIKDKIAMQKTQIFNVIILDRSGSMQRMLLIRFLLILNCEPTLKSKACLKCLYFTIIISDLYRYLEYFSYLYINKKDKDLLKQG